MRDVQSTFRGYAPDPRGGLRPPEVVYETDEHARPRPTIIGIVLGSLTIFCVIYAIAHLVLTPFGVELPRLVN